jgi:AcrR family transcriptional regulator
VTVTEGLRERKKAETRLALSSAALRLAEQLGPDGVTVEAIAEAAGVSPRTFFNYFSSKDDAIVGINPSDPSQMLEDLARRPAGEPPLASLRAATLAVAGRLEAHADDLVARDHLVQRYPSLAVRRTAGYAVMEQALVEEIGRRTGLDPARDPYPALAVAAAIAAIRVVVGVWHDQDRPGPLADALAAAFDQIAAGLPAPVPALSPG